VKQQIREHGKVVIGTAQVVVLSLLTLAGIKAYRVVRRLGGRHDGDTVRVHQRGHGEDGP